MGLRLYPDPEGYVDAKGVPYPFLPEGQTRTELQKFISALRDGCHRRSWGLIIESLNHGQHTGHSMHYAGLALDFNCYRISAETGQTMRMYTTFEEQKMLVSEVVGILGYDAWCWPDDPSESPTHTHVSIHP